ncbi:MAG: methenyltetrahydromethanopterin cyclohydrolase [Candidatus Heimdallarchaeota archaeon]|nr:methenyltetrahydromethanopterin cyclohydrolase [Candidatus Heimdallarchaeota archaeon]
MYDKISLTEGALLFVNELIDDAENLKVEVLTINDATVIDCGINTEGSIDAALLFIKISLGGLATIQPSYPKGNDDLSYIEIQVATNQPVLATLGCQAASWNIAKGNFFGMACGPGRALAQKPSKIYKLLNYQEEHKTAILCIESDILPSDEIIDYLAEKCNVERRNLVLLMIKTACIVEYFQMAARAIELGIFRMVEQLNYPKDKILSAVGTGLVAPFSTDREISNDRVNNALIYGTRFDLIIKAIDDNHNIAELINKIPSKSSTFFGKSFLEVFNEAGKDFANFDLSLLAPTEVHIAVQNSQEKYQAGKIDKELLKRFW